ncbi:MAG: hypothetical protein CMP50_03660 [Flavobacteriales bacterium]|jgi:hypothetical protein|nr:hypothetical protein [Flavobacteriales bacterium]|tara:strand:+ start:553 stop:1461 length:909 start_codon:yes stop_codon:yes gene_type:complete
MIKQILFLTFFFYSFIVFSQCEVNENQAPFLADPVGAYSLQLIDGQISTDPLLADIDTLTAFPNAIEGELYQAVVGVRIPNDTSFVYELTPGEPQLFENVQINSITINSVVISESTTGAVDLPTGFSWNCVGGDGSSDCVWAGGDYGCISFGFESEVPSGLVGAHRLNVLLDVNASYELFPGVPVPIELTVDDLLNYYVLVVEESNNNSSISEIIDARNFSMLGISPNPANDYFSLEYGNNQNGLVDVKIYDILGNIVKSVKYNSVVGYNEVTLSTSDLISGIYTVIVSNNFESIIERLIID